MPTTVVYSMIFIGLACTVASLFVPRTATATALAVLGVIINAGVLVSVVVA